MYSISFAHLRASPEKLPGRGSSATGSDHLLQYIGQMRLLLTFIFAVLFSQAGNGQLRKPLMDIIDSMNAEYPALKEQYSPNKELAPDFEKQICFALSYFPEFSETKIRFVRKKTKRNIISTQPSFGSIFRSSRKRTYRVIINDSTAGRGSFPTFKNGDANSQVGILGHEFCHILYFSHKTGLGLIGLAIKHISKRFMDRFEYNTDSMNIVRGLGYQLLSWNLYLRKYFPNPDAELRPAPFSGANRERYMTPAAIRMVISKTPLYDEQPKKL
jgi:hypothetical protein